MITKEFRRWAEDIKDSIQEQVGELVYIWMNNTRPDVIDIGIEFLEGQGFWMSFCQQEFNINDEKRRRELIKMRHKDFIRQIKDFAEKVNKTVKALQ